MRTMGTNIFEYYAGQYRYANRPQAKLWEEYGEYIAENDLSKYERKLLRDWIKAGHSVYETVESMYMTAPAYPPMDFIGAYRLDRSITEDMEGLTKDEKDDYLKELMGWEDPSPEYLAMEEAKRNTPRLIEDRVRRLERELFNLWEFVWQEGLGSEAREFVDDHKDEETPFEW